MPGPFRFQYIFAVGQQGDSETWYSNVGLTLQQASNQFALTIPTRNSLLGYPAYIQAQKTVDLSNPRVSIVRSFNSPWAPAAVPVPVIRRDTAWNCVQVRLSDSSGQYRRTMEIRGVPDDWISFTAAGVPIFAAAFSNAMKAWIAAAKAAALPLSWKALPKIALGVPSQPITAVSFPAPPGPVQITAPNHGLQLNQGVGIYNCRGLNITGLPPQKEGLNGRHLCTSVIDANNFTIELSSSQFAAGAVVFQFGGIRPIPFSPVPNPAPGSLNWQYPTISGFIPMNFSRRQAGRPFFLPLGHRRAIRRS